MFQRLALYLALCIGMMACQPRTHFVRQQYSTQAINDQTPSDTSITAMIAPYKSKVAQEMGAVIGSVAETLAKGQPESTLGNWVADLVYHQAELYTKAEIDFALVNYGGLRIPSLPAGPLTKGKVFELMPFDNTIVVVEMPGEEMQQVFDHIAQKGGWPVSSQVRMNILNGKAQGITINGALLDNRRLYRIATNDYIANGGDQSTFFKGKKQLETGVLFRDAIIAYVQGQAEPIRAKLEHRITGGE